MSSRTLTFMRSILGQLLDDPASLGWSCENRVSAGHEFVAEANPPLWVLRFDEWKKCTTLG